MGRILGTEELEAVYGYFPTFHDARITKVEQEYFKKTLKLVFYYSDLPDGSREEIRSLITLEFSGARPFELRMTEDWVHQLDLEETEDGVTASWSEQRMGFQSKVHAQGLKCSIGVIDEQV